MKKTAIKITFIPLVITLLFFSFVGTSLAGTYFVPPFVVYKTVSDLVPTNTLSITENIDSYDISCTTITGACVIGTPLAVLPDSVTRTTRTLNVTYQVLSVSTPTKCEIGLITGLRTISTGAISVTATTTEITTNIAHSGVATPNAFGFGIRSNDTSNPCTMLLRVKQISNTAGDTLWSPAINGYNNGITINLDSSASSTDTTKNDNMLEMIATIMLFTSLIFVSFAGLNFFLQFKK